MPRIASTPYLPQLIAVSATCGVLATIAWANHATPIASAEVPVPVIESSVVEARAERIAQVVRQPAPPREQAKLLFVFGLDNETYVKISDDTPKHGKRRLAKDDGSSTIAEVDPANLPATLRGWTTKQLIVDGGCTATVTGFAVVTRMVGSPPYAGLESETWTARTAAAAGTSQLAARLAVPEVCKTALYARDAATAPMAELEKLDRPELVEQARAALLASPVADAAQTAWEMDGQNTGPWIDHAEVTSFTRRHPTTGEVFVGMHASIQEGCGGPQVNVWGLFRVTRDGALETVHLDKLESIYSIERILDVDNDGKLELLGRDWLGLSMLHTRADGAMLEQLPMQFHGCPC